MWACTHAHLGTHTHTQRMCTHAHTTWFQMLHFSCRHSFWQSRAGEGVKIPATRGAQGQGQVNEERRKSWPRVGGLGPSSEEASRKGRGTRGKWERSPPHQVVASMFGLEHLGHLPEVAPEVLLIGRAGEGDGDDPLCDIYQVQLTTVLHGAAHTHVSGKTSREVVLGQTLAQTRARNRYLFPLHIAHGPLSNPGGWLLPGPEPGSEASPGKASAASKSSLGRRREQVWAGPARVPGHVRTSEDSSPVSAAFTLGPRGQSQAWHWPGSQGPALPRHCSPRSGRTILKGPGTVLEGKRG